MRNSLAALVGQVLGNAVWIFVLGLILNKLLKKPYPSIFLGMAILIILRLALGTASLYGVLMIIVAAFVVVGIYILLKIDKTGIRVKE